MPEIAEASQRTSAELAGIPTSVWVTAQEDSRTQRRGRYLPSAIAHPAKMLPAIAAHAITQYSAKGDTILDPMCGIGTTLVEAIHLGRNALGVEYESRWAHLARANLAHARAQGATGTGHVIHGDARTLTRLVNDEHRGTVALVLTSPPYGAATHGHILASRNSGQPGVTKFDHRYGTDRGNLANATLDNLLEGFTAILTQCAALLRPGGTVAVTTRPWRQHGELIDLPSAVIAAGQRAGLLPVERCVALLAGIRDGQLVARPSFFQLKNIRDARAAGVPLSLIVHEDVVVLRAIAPGSMVNTGQAT